MARHRDRRSGRPDRRLPALAQHRSGRRYIVRQINNLETASGLDIDIARIEGSIFGELTIHGLTLKDPRGTFFYAPTATVDYRPFAYFRNHVDIRELEIPRARLMRLPQLKPGDPNAPLLPNIDVDIGRLHIGQLLIDPAVFGPPACDEHREHGQDRRRPRPRRPRSRHRPRARLPGGDRWC